MKRSENREATATRAPEIDHDEGERERDLDREREWRRAKICHEFTGYASLRSVEFVIDYWI